MKLSALPLWIVMMSGPAVAQEFEDVAPALGISGSPSDIGSGLGGGVSWADLDGDGHLDLLFTPPTQPPLFFRQVPGGFETDESSFIPLTPPGAANGSVPFDMDRDGDLDVLLLRVGANVLFENLGGGVFQDVSATHLPGSERWTVSAAPGDFDGDGDDDLLVANYIAGVSFPAHDCEPSELWINDGAGRFVDRAADFGVTGRGCSLAAAMCDTDGDGDLDLLVANDFGVFSRPNELYRNDGPLPGGGWSFVDVSAEAGFDAKLYAMGLAVADVDDDGRLDVYATSIGRQSFLLGGPGGVFTDATDAFGAGIVLADTGYQLTWGAIIEDLDADGWLDLFAAGGHIPAAPFIANPDIMPNLVMAGTPSYHFVEKPPGWQLDDPPGNHGRGVSAADYDGDGRTDLAVGHATGLLSIFRNASLGPPPLRVRPVTRYTGRAAVGTRVFATCEGLTRMRELTVGGTLGGVHEQVVRFTFPGLCNAPGRPVDLLVRWPSGYVTTATTTTGASVSVGEPEWLTISGAIVVASPTSPAGAPLPIGASVVITADGATVGPTLPGPAGTWHAELGAEGADVVLGVTVEGVAMPVHPRVRRSTSLTLQPQHAVVGTPFAAIAVPRTSDGALVGDGHDVALQTPTGLVPAWSLGEGAYRATTIAPDAPGPMPIVVLVDGQPSGAAHVTTIVPPFDAELSHVKVSPLYFEGGQVPKPQVHTFLRLVDRNGRPYQGDDASIEVSVDGLLVPPLMVQSSGAERLLSLPAEPFVDGATVTVAASGYPATPAMLVHHVALASEIGGYIDAARSYCATSMAAMHADGTDVLTAFVFLKDAFGNPIPLQGTSPVPALDGLSMVAGSLKIFQEYVQLQVRAGTTPGKGTIGIAAWGKPVGVSCTVDLLPPAPPSNLSPTQSTLTIATAGLTAGFDGTTANVRFEPRTPLGRLAGSGLPVTFSTTLGAFQHLPVYIGLGRYEATMLAGDVPGTATVTASVTSPPLSISAEVVIAPPSWWPPDTGEPDAGSVEDVAGAADIEDVAELEDGEVEEPEVEVPEPEPPADAAPDIEPPDVAEPIPPEPEEDIAAPPEPDDAPEASDLAEPPPIEPEPAPEPPGDDVISIDAHRASDVSTPEPDAPAAPDVPAPPSVAGDGGCTAGARAPTSAPLVLIVLLLFGWRREAAAP